MGQIGECLKSITMGCRCIASRQAARSCRVSVDMSGWLGPQSRALPMIYSATTEYAIRALAHMATLEPGERILARDLAAATDVPRQFLGKILHRLARQGMLDSAKGRGGGFRFSRPAEQITLADLV